MTKAQREQFALELESGKYPQTLYMLHRLYMEYAENGEEIPPGYCCLGVANEVFKLGIYENNSSPYPLPESFLDKGAQKILTRMNDAKESFKAIAARVRTLPTSD